MTANKYGVKVGDIFYASWGYDETHVNFYEVVRVTTAKAEIAPIAGAWADNQYRGVVPARQVRDYDVLIRVNREDAKKTKLCTVIPGTSPSIVLRGGQYTAYLWDGKPKHQTDPWSGH